MAAPDKSAGDRAPSHRRRVNRSQATAPVAPRRPRHLPDRSAAWQYLAVEPPWPFSVGFNYREPTLHDIPMDFSESWNASERRSHSGRNTPVGLFNLGNSEPRPGTSREGDPRRPGPLHQQPYTRPSRHDMMQQAYNAMYERLSHGKMSLFGTMVLQCLDCGEFPHPPVTGPCGHSRCRCCVLDNPRCPCGVLSSSIVSVDVVSQHILEGFMEYENCFGYSSLGEEDDLSGGYASMFCPDYIDCSRPYNSPNIDSDPTMKALIMEHQSQPFFNVWKFARPIFLHVVQFLARGWFEQGDLDCSICGEHFRLPVATPCGHTFCRACIERNMDYRLACPLCAQSLTGFNLVETAETVFLMNMIELSGRSAEEIPDPLDRVPIFICTVAFPNVPCPLYVFEPCYRLMIRRLRKSGRRHFGMVCADPVEFPAYGTMLEIRDNVMLPDGRSILSTVGKYRFRILEREMHNGYNIARIARLTDMPEPAQHIAERYRINQRAHSVHCLAQQWLRRMCPRARAEIETSFGVLPALGMEHSTSDGPAWLWWVIALLPLSEDLKMVILCSTSFYKRLLTVERTLRSVLLLESIRERALVQQARMPAHPTDCLLPRRA